jgi:hypothetical protein
MFEYILTNGRPLLDGLNERLMLGRHVVTRFHYLSCHSLLATELFSHMHQLTADARGPEEQQKCDNTAP